MITLASVNAMDAATFIAAFGDIAEHSPWVAEGVIAAKDSVNPSGSSLAREGDGVAQTNNAFSSVNALSKTFADIVMNAPHAQQLSLLRAHPDLATRARLTADSKAEQKDAGLDTLSTDEFATFTKLNNQYTEQNGFPFIFAVKGASKQQILASFDDRIHNARDSEFQVALQQVCKIIGFRLEMRIGH